MSATEQEILMEDLERVDLAGRIMLDFARRTGIESSGVKPRRYLWTDAFAVCNFLALHHRTGEPRYRELALALVEQVHHILGRYAGSDSRTGWISGLTDEQGEAHPTRGGLRIGKSLPERGPDEPFSERQEWNRDGQYYHYLTKWMLALNRLAEQTGNDHPLHWAVELARAAHAGFTYRSLASPKPRMYWKMSIDLSRPLVESMGHHDPLDGLLTYHELQAAATGIKSAGPVILKAEIDDMKAMGRGVDWTTDDALGLGGILADGLRAARLVLTGYAELEHLLLDLLRAAEVGLSFLSTGPTLRYPAGYRLAFRELGLAIGLQAAERIKKILTTHTQSFADPQRLGDRLQNVLHHTPMGETIEDCWLRDENQHTEGWLEHEDINTVMLATSLLPDGYFGEIP